MTENLIQFSSSSYLEVDFGILGLESAFRKVNENHWFVAKSLRKAAQPNYGNKVKKNVYRARTAPVPSTVILMISRTLPMYWGGNVTVYTFIPTPTDIRLGPNVCWNLTRRYRPRKIMTIFFFYNNPNNFWFAYSRKKK